MKLASYKDGSRDGQLVVVSGDLGLAHYATGIATRLQQVLDDWNFLSPQLEELSRQLDHGKARHAFPFDPRMCLAPLPRGLPWAEASGDAGGVPSLRFGRPDFLGACDLLDAPDDMAGGDHQRRRNGTDVDAGEAARAGLPVAEEGLDLEARVVVASGDLPRGITAASALDGVRLLMFAAPLRRRGDAASPVLPEDERGIAFAPVAVTPDTLGAAWQGGRLAARLELRHNGRRLGLVDLPADGPHAGLLLAALARHAGLRAGSLVASPAITAGDGAQGHASLHERRARERADHGAPRSGWLKSGDTLRLELTGRDGQSLFGAIDLAVAQPDEDSGSASNGHGHGNGRDRNADAKADTHARAEPGDDGDHGNDPTADRP